MPDPASTPPPTIPSWLDPKTEQPFHTENIPKDQFVLGCMAKLMTIGCDPLQAAGVTSNAVNEAAWGKAVVCGNAFGWKITRSFADNYKTQMGKSAPWWKAKGHVESGDPEWCFYRVFPSFSEALPEWVKKFTPKSSELPLPPHPPAKDSYRYRKTGEVFWAGGDWFPELIQAGYKGPVTQAKPDASIAEHQSIKKTVLAMWVQSRLNILEGPAIHQYQIDNKKPVTGVLVVDGKIGAMSIAIIKSFQKHHNMAQTGTVDETLVRAVWQV